MKLDVLRFADSGDATMSVFQINGVSYNFGIEDEERDVKVKGETRVPEGTYQVSLRTEGGYHTRESKRYMTSKYFLLSPESSCVYPLFSDQKKRRTPPFTVASALILFFSFF